MQRIMMFFQWNISEGEVNMTNYPEATSQLRNIVIRILSAKFDDYTSICECADDWCSKQVTSHGVVKYYEAYFNNTK